MQTPKRIAIIGNGGGGKTTLSRALAQRYGLPLTHVDSIQFLPGMKKRATEETRHQLNQIAGNSHWLIDGFGPMDVIVRRFELADAIVFVDFPLWRHYWWCTKRQLKSFCSSAAERAELPPGCREGTLAYTWELYKILWRVHRRLRPELLRHLSAPAIASKTHFINNLKDWKKTYRAGLLKPVELLANTP